MLNPDVSIIIPIYNAENHIHDCVNSVISQTHRNIEIILIDDGSKDSSYSICVEYAKKDSRIKVIHQENNGVSYTRNQGIEYASGKYLLFLDADDKIDDNLIEENFSIIEKSQADVVIFGFRYFYPDNASIVENSLDNDFYGSNDEFFQHMLITIMDKEWMNAPWNKLIRTALVKEKQIRFDTRFSIYEDFLFSIKICEVAQSIYVNRRTYHQYNLWGQGSLRTRYSRNRFEAAKELYGTAMNYCEEHSDHSIQCERFSLWFVCSVIYCIKVICICKEIANEQKEDALLEICSDSLFINALRNTVFTGNFYARLKKKVIRWMILHKKIFIIRMMYRYG